MHSPSSNVDKVAHQGQVCPPSPPTNYWSDPPMSYRVNSHSWLSCDTVLKFPSYLKFTKKLRLGTFGSAPNRYSNNVVTKNDCWAKAVKSYCFIWNVKLYSWEANNWVRLSVKTVGKLLFLTWNIILLQTIYKCVIIAIPTCTYLDKNDQNGKKLDKCQF